MNVNDRRQAILEIINKEGQVRAVELASRLNVTGETIRKDLIYLSDKNLLRKNHGSAQAISEFIERSVDARAQENAMFKREIARTALDQLNNCSVIFIDSGSTLMEMAKLLSKRPDLAIITNSFSIIQTLMDSENTIYFIGGEVASCNPFGSTLPFSEPADFSHTVDPARKHFLTRSLKKRCCEIPTGLSSWRIIQNFPPTPLFNSQSGRISTC